MANSLSGWGWRMCQEHQMMAMWNREKLPERVQELMRVGAPNGVAVGQLGVMGG